MKSIRVTLVLSFLFATVAPARAADVPHSRFAPQHKSYALGSVLSVVPGVLVHGTGHHYAGAHGQALVLHALEGTAIGLIVVGATRGFDQVQNFGSELPGDISVITRWEGMILGGTVLFLSSWLYDIFGTPKAVSAWNAGVDREAAEAAAYSPQPVAGGNEAGGAVAAGGTR